MSLLNKTIILRGSRGEIKVEALFDSGASYSCINADTAQKVAVPEPLAEPMEFETAEAEAKLIATKAVRLDFYFTDSNRRFTDELIVIDNLSEPLIIGATTLQKWKIRLDFEREEIVYDKKMHRLRI